MSKRDYELIAEIISGIAIVSDEARWAVAAEFAKALKNENNAFRIDTFLEACKRGHKKKNILGVLR